MAETDTKKLNILTVRQRQTLTELGPKFDKAQKSLELLDKLGLGTVELKDKLDWAKKQRDILLKEG